MDPKKILSAVNTRRQLLRCLTNALGRIHQSLILVCPHRDCFAIFGYGLQMRKRGLFPINGSYNYWYDMCLASLVALQCTLHFLAITVVRVQKVGTNQQQNEVCEVKILSSEE